MSAWKNSALRRRVARAEHVLEQRRHRLDATWSRLKRDGREALTPGRIVIAGLALGFLFGRAAPLAQLAGGARLLKFTGSFIGLINSAMAAFAAAQAEDAAEDAEEAADEAGEAAENVGNANGPATRATADADAAEAPARADADAVIDEAAR